MKFAATLLTACFSFAAGSALAQDAMKKDDMSMKKDTMCADMMKTDPMMKKDDAMMKKDDALMKKDGMAEPMKK